MNKFWILLLLFGSGLLFACGNEQNSNSNSTNERKTVKAKPQEKEKTTPASTTSAKKEKTPAPTPIPKEQLKKAKEIIASVSKADIKAVDTKKKFKQFCAICHGFTGDLNVNGAKDLTISKVSLEESVAQVYHGRGLMTPFKGIMADAEIVAVAKYIETLRK